jgi:beta-galactosidase
MASLCSIFVFALLVVTTTKAVSNVDGNMENALSFVIDYANARFLLDGKPFRYISSSLHYFRIHQDLWLDRLQRVRAAGINAIQVIVPWNWHEVYKRESVS